MNDLWVQWGETLLWTLGCGAAGLVIDQVIFSALRSRGKDGQHPLLLQLAAGLHWLPTSLGLILGARIGITASRMSGEAPRRRDLGHQASHDLRCSRPSAPASWAASSARYAMRDNTPLPSGSIFVNLARGVVWVVGDPR